MRLAVVCSNTAQVDGMGGREEDGRRRRQMEGAESGKEGGSTGGLDERKRDGGQVWRTDEGTFPVNRRGRGRRRKDCVSWTK